ncbi:MAG TPA: hypothetical protein VMZ74_01335 [Ramlibacter sp.]|nr:hypothetical protein [Ramlibacter sp.]
MKINLANKASAKILNRALKKTEQVQQDLGVAATELGETNDALSGAMSRAQAIAAIAGAVEQNRTVETKVQDAADDLDAVKDLLKDAGLAQAQNRQGLTGEGSASLVPHLNHSKA